MALSLKTGCTIWMWICKVTAEGLHKSGYYWKIFLHPNASQPIAAFSANGGLFFLFVCLCVVVRVKKK